MIKTIYVAITFFSFARCAAAAPTQRKKMARAENPPFQNMAVEIDPQGVADTAVPAVPKKSSLARRAKAQTSVATVGVKQASRRQDVQAISAELREFKKLMDEGILNEDEFKQKKAQLLSREGEGEGKGEGNGERRRKLPSSTSSKGVNDIIGYNAVANAFVGLNPKLGDGSGFVIRDQTNEAGAKVGVNIKDAGFPYDHPSSGGPRVNLCTCDCKAGHDGVGCVGWGGVAFKYSTLLWTNPYTGRWEGQIQAYQSVGDGLNFIGSDTRVYPGGPAIYNVACTTQSCSDVFSGVFRQANSAVNCTAGLEDETTAKGLSEITEERCNEADDETKDECLENLRIKNSQCFTRCGNSQKYTDWLAYCKATEEDNTMGFSGKRRKREIPWNP